MDWIQQNLDAYRIVAEILTVLRDNVRRALEVELGENWHRDGLPKPVLDRLVQRKEKEKAIDWHESEYQEVTSYAGFADVLEILQANPELIPEFMKLASNPALLYARFLELEVIAQKLALARAVGESELTFLGTFHIRFRKAVEELKARGLRKRKESAKSKPNEKPADAPPDPEKQAAPPSEPEAEPKPEPKQQQKKAKPETEKESEPETKPEPEEEVSKSKPKQDRPPQRAASTPQRPPMRPAMTPNGPAPDKDAGKAKDKENKTEDKAAAADDTSAAEEQQASSIEKAIKEGNSQLILKELYREVTNLAEGVWTSDVVPIPHVWSQVSGSTWYEFNFTRLSLKPLSDFYEIIAKVDEHMQEGITKEQLQEILKENHFAQILLSLRDMFQKNNI
jgi:outer membrane biosynthesis protein TonB